MTECLNLFSYNQNQEIMLSRIEIFKGDITTLNIDAIVNAANTSLLGGGGVDGAIHRTAGNQLLEECKTLNGCPTGEAKLTKGYLLPAKFVIHTVGPVWNGGNRNENELLKSCYTRSLQIAKEQDLDTIAFPNISTGVYRFPKHKAAQIAITTTIDFLKTNDTPKKVIFAIFDEENLQIYNQLIDQHKR